MNVDPGALRGVLSRRGGGAFLHPDDATSQEEARDVKKKGFVFFCVILMSGAIYTVPVRYNV